MFYLYLLSLLFLNIPNYQFFFINSQAVFGFTTVFTFLFIFFSKKLLFLKKLTNNWFELSLYLIFFVTLSVSILQTQDQVIFLTKYIGFAIVFLLYLNTLFYSDQIIRFIKYVFFFWVSINLFDELFFFLDKNLYLKNFSSFLAQKSYLFITDLAVRGRLMVTSYNEIFLLVIYNEFLFSKKKYIRLISLFLLVLLNALSFLSGWRIRGFLCLINFFIFFLVIKKHVVKQKVNHLIKPIIITVIALVLFTLASQYTSFRGSTIDRLQSKENSFDSSNMTRLKILKESFNIFLSVPFFGVGLNNNSLYRKSLYQGINKSEKTSINFFKEAGSHNFYMDLLLESGIIGFSSFMLLIFYWLRNDLKNIKISNLNILSYQSAYYLLLIFACFHSIGGYRFFSIILLLRTLIRQSFKNQKQYH